MDHIRKQAKAGRAAKLARFGGMASDINRVKNGMPSRDGSAPGYASGGSVGGDDIGGTPSRPNLSKPGRKMGKGKDKKGGTNVNVIVMPKGGDGPPPMGGAGPPMPPHPMPMPPPGAGPGGPPMPPMHKHGGAVGKYATGGRIGNLGKYAHGGKIKRADGGWTGEGDSGKAKKEEAAAIENGRVGPTLSGGTMGAGIGTLLANKGIRAPVAKLFGAAMTGLGGMMAKGDMDSAGRAKRANKAGDEAEGRKRGGSVSRMKMKKR